MRPPAPVLEAFGVAAEPRPLEGGQGRAWLAGDVVLKPVDELDEHAWVCQVYDGWSSAEVRVPQPLRAGDAWAFEGWGAHVLVPGEDAHVADDPRWFRDAHDAFHEAVGGRDRPSFLDDRDDAWSHGDRVAWEGVDPEGDPLTLGLLAEALELLEPVALPAQVVHGDLGGNVLRDGDRPVVIDWPPYWRPPGWALAVVACDAVCWEGADPSLLDRWSDEPSWPQLLLRAVVYRVATRGRNEARGVVPAGSDGFVTRKGWMLRLVRERL